MLPELFKIPSLGITIWTYGVMLDAGIIAAFWLIGRVGARDGLPRRQLYSLLVFAGSAAFIGAQLLMIVSNGSSVKSWHQYFSLNHLHASGAFFGALLLVLPTTVILTRALELPWLKTLDAIAPGIALAYAIARLGCFAAGCCWGKPNDSWIGVRFTQRAHELNSVPIDVALVPTQLILAGVGFLIFASLLWLHKRRAFDGQIILAYLMLYSVARFTIEFWRADPRGEVLGFSLSQFISAVLFPIASLTYLWLTVDSYPATRVSKTLSPTKP